MTDPRTLSTAALLDGLDSAVERIIFEPAAKAEARTEHNALLAELRRRLPRWRKEPPTVEEVRDCEWWWACTRGETKPLVMQLDINEILGVVVCVNDDCDPLIPGDWGDSWMPCIPLDEE